MNKLILASALLASLTLAACDPKPTVVNVPTPVAVPGPAGPTGATGATGVPGKTGDSPTTVIVTPPAPAASK